nr:zinc-binding dehydrogenase [Streptomyces luteocolor]
MHLRATFPLERAADAHRLIATRHGRGKVVLTVG